MNLMAILYVAFERQTEFQKQVCVWTQADVFDISSQMHRLLRWVVPG